MKEKQVRSEEISEYVGYMISNHGYIIERETGKVLKVYANGTCLLRHESGKMKNVTAHRLIAQAFVPQPPGHRWLKFKDGNHGNLAANNLEWSVGVRKMGALSKEIINLKESGMTSVQIAEVYMITPQYVNLVLRNHKKKQRLMKQQSNQN